MSILYPERMYLVLCQEKSIIQEAVYNILDEVKSVPSFTYSVYTIMLDGTMVKRIGISKVL